MKLIIATVLAFITVSANAQAVDPHVTQANIKSTICTRGYTKTVRPSVQYTNKIKRQLMTAQHLPMTTIGQYELDHIIPLEVGGCGSCLNNLRLQIKAGANGALIKDAKENNIHASVCSGATTLKAGQQYFVIHWGK